MNKLIVFSNLIGIIAIVSALGIIRFNPPIEENAKAFVSLLFLLGAATCLISVLVAAVSITNRFIKDVK